MENISQYLPFIIPLGIIQLGLMTAALIHIFKHKKYRMGNRVLWVLISVFVNTIGPVLYFCLGRASEEDED